MSLMDEILDKAGLKYEDLNSAERETLNVWMSRLEQSQMTLESVRSAVSDMKDAVEQELISEPEFNYLFIFKIPNRKQILLKARLKNYLLLEAFLSSPDKAKKALDRAVSGLVSQKR